jgi:LacI family transcriptional regulator
MLVTLRDVAALAEVSLATAARVLRDDPTLRVRPETRDHVLAAAKALRYRPNRLASGLRTRRSGTIAVFLPEPRNLGWGPMLEGIEHVADEASHLVALSDIRGPALRPDVFARYALEGRVDGALVAPSTLSDALLGRLAAAGMTLVTFGRTRIVPGSVTMQDDVGTCLAVDHLLELGHASDS